MRFINKITLKLLLASITERMVTSQSELRRMEERIESLEETVEVLADRRLLSSIKRSLDDIKQGRYRDYTSAKEFRAKFESKT
jgi:archaellum component FlaC